MSISRVAQVRNYILSSIRAGMCADNDRLPAISDFAKLFDVSIDTVQKAVNSLKEIGVIEAKRGKGLFVRLSNLKPGAGCRIGLINAGPSSDYLEHETWPAVAIKPLRQKLIRAGYELVPISLAEANIFNLVGALRGQEFAALILFEIHSEHLIWQMQELSLPMISVDFDAYRLGVSSVVFDSIAGTFDSTNYVIGCGHRNIVFVRTGFLQHIGAFTFMDAETDQRLQGYRLAMHQAGLPERVVEFDMKAPDFAGRIQALLNQAPAPTALCLPNSHHAALFARIAQKMGVNIPADLSITGFGVPTETYAPEKYITTVNPDVSGMGNASAQLFLSLLQVANPKPQRITLPVALEIRDSVAKLPPHEAKRPHQKHLVAQSESIN